MHVNMSSAKWWPFCPGADELKGHGIPSNSYLLVIYTTTKTVSDKHNEIFFLTLGTIAYICKVCWWRVTPFFEKLQCHKEIWLQVETA